MASSSKSGSRLRDLMVSYGSYHDNIINKVIHIVCVPLILTTAAALLQHVDINTLGFKLNLSLYSLMLVMVYYLSLDRVSGLIATALYLFAWKVQHHFYQNGDADTHFKVSLGIFVVSWILQFIGHGVFEKRKPALMDNLTQVFSAPLFVVVEVLFLFGWRSDVRTECQKSIKENIAQFRSAAKSN